MAENWTCFWLPCHELGVGAGRILNIQDTRNATGKVKHPPAAKSPNTKTDAMHIEALGAMIHHSYIIRSCRKVALSGLTTQ